MNNGPYKQIFTAANIVTTVRIALIPIFVVAILAPWPSWVPDTSIGNLLEAVKPWIAAGVFALLALTDSVDGYLARSRNEVTTLGKFLDPLADKILVSAALLALIELGELPAWVALIIITREFLVSGLRMVVSSEGVVIAASPLGKAKTIAQIFAVLLFIVKSSPIWGAGSPQLQGIVYVVAWVVMVIALLLTLWSLADYFFRSSSALGLPLGKPNSGDNNVAQVITNPELAAEVIGAARERGLSIGTAESCTGGLVAAALTTPAGASDVFKGSVVSYANQVKQNSLGVDGQTLAEYGAVSSQTARQMALGACQNLGVDVAVSATGIAGPGGGTAEKPVGTVWFGVAALGSDGVATATSELHNFTGTRQQIREQATTVALQLLKQSCHSDRA
jgi:CDP-diacylglycerol--glycerol-3-phosphate 3-phosphatidyltransferase